MSRKIVGNTVGTNLNPEKVQVEMPDMSEYVKNTDYVTQNSSGVVKVQATMGIGANNGLIYINPSYKRDIDKKTSQRLPITPHILDYAVKKALSDCKLEGDDVWTEEEKASALKMLGGVPKFDGSKETGKLRFTVYAQELGEQVQRQMASVPSEGALAIYGSGATLKTNLVRNDLDCANKKYVDDLNTKLRANIEYFAIKTKASGEVVAMTDSANVKPKNIMLFGKSVQDGIPSTEAPIIPVHHGESGSIVGKVLNGNFFDVSKISSFTDEMIAQYGYGIKVDKNGVVSVTSTQTSSGLSDLTNSELIDLAPNLQVGETYTLNAITSANTNKYIYLYGANIIWTFGTSKALTEEMLNSRVLFYSDGVGETDYISEIMLNYGTEPLPFKPYTEQPFTALTPNGLRGIDDARDYRDYAEGKNVQHIQKYVCDSNTTITDLTRYGTFENNALFRITATGVKQQGKILCTHMRYEGFVWGDKFGCAIIEQGMIDFSIPYELLGLTSNSTADERISAVKVLLQNNPIEFYAELEEPIVTDLTQEEINQYNTLVMNYPNTTIINDAGAYMEVEYVADTKCYIDNKFKQLEIALANTNANLL